MNPIKDMYSRNGIVIPHPCYEVFFEKYKNDTIISIKLVPFLVIFNPLDFEIDKGNDSLLSEKKISSGYFLFKNQPIIIFDEKNLSNKILKKNNLNSIPDSLKWDFGKANIHLKSKSEFYKLTNLELNKIEL